MTFDLSPLFRSTVGFDRMSRLFEDALSDTAQPAYPPYNIEKLGENEYRIVMAVAEGKLIPAKSGAGESDLQARAIQFNNYTFLKKGEKPDLFRLNLSIEGKGKVWIKDVELTAQGANIRRSTSPGTLRPGQGRVGSQRPAPAEP